MELHIKQILTRCILSGVLLSFSLIACTRAYPIETLLLLAERTLPDAENVNTGGAIVTDKDSERLRFASRKLPISEDGLRKALTNGTQADGMIAAANSITACLIKTGQGRRIAILNSFLFPRFGVFTEYEKDGKAISKRSSSIVLNQVSNKILTVVPLEGLLVRSLRAKAVGNQSSRPRIVDESRAATVSYASDLREVCHQRDTVENNVEVKDAKPVNFTNLAFNNTRLDSPNPYARLPNSTRIIKVRYDTYEVVLQAIAVSLLLLDLFILDDFKNRKIRFYHVLGVLLLAAATVITVVMGWLQVFDVLSEQSSAWMSCGSYNIRQTDNEVSAKTAIIYNVLCEWVVIHAESTGWSYLILLPSAFGAILLLFIVSRFVYLKYRYHHPRPETLDEEAKMVAERERAAHGSSRSRAIAPRFGLARSGLVTTAVFSFFCGVMSQKFPPESVERVGPNFVANGQVLFIGGVAVASPWRCTWESRKGPTDDVTSIEGIDDCFARWAPPKEDESTGLLFGEGKVTPARCSPKGLRCPFTGTLCPGTDTSFDCNSSLIVPKPIKFLPKSAVDLVERWCSFGSQRRKTTCRLILIGKLAKYELALLTREIKRNLGDEKVNVHRISEYEFPDCAGPPKNLSGSDSGKSTQSQHFAVAGDNCINSERLARLARKRSRIACKEKIDKKKVCKNLHWFQSEQRCRMRLVHLCTDALYTELLLKSRFMRAADDWLASRCHQGGMTSFGPLKNWVANKEAVIIPDDGVPKDKDTGRPLIRPVRQGWVFTSNPLSP